MSKSSKDLAKSFGNLMNSEVDSALSLESENEKLRTVTNKIIENQIDDLLYISDKELPSTIEDNTKEILVLKKHSQRNIWLIGQRLDKINEEKLYLNILDENNKSKYNGFIEYVKNELDFQPRTAYNFITIYKNFGVQPVAQVEYSKLLLISKVEDEETKNELVKEVLEKNLSRSALNKRVKEYIPEPGLIENKKKKGNNLIRRNPIGENVIVVFDKDDETYHSLEFRNFPYQFKDEDKELDKLIDDFDAAITTLILKKLGLKNKKELDEYLEKLVEDEYEEIVENKAGKKRKKGLTIYKFE